MPKDDIRVTLSAHNWGDKPGDSIKVDERQAKRLIAAGIAVPATVPEAKKVDADPDTAATKR